MKSYLSREFLKCGWLRCKLTFNKRHIIVVGSKIDNCQDNFEENLVSNRTTELWIDLQSGYFGNHNYVNYIEIWNQKFNKESKERWISQFTLKQNNWTVFTFIPTCMILQICWLLLQTKNCKGIPKSYLKSIWGRTCHTESIE
jgi:hypothetical protein